MFDDFKRGCDCFKRGAYSEALHYFRVAISDYGYSFDLNAAAHVGYCHEKGYGTPKDLYSAAQWYRFVITKGGKKWEDSWVVKRLRAIEAVNPQSKESFPVVINDCRIGRIVNTPDDEIVRFRVKDGCVYVNGALNMPYDDVVWRVMTFLKERVRTRAMSIPDVINENCYADYPYFKLRIKRGGGHAYSHRVEGCCYTILAPHDVVFEYIAVRETLVNYIKRLIKEAATRFIVSRTAEIAQRIGLTDYVSCEVCSLKNFFGWFCEDKRLKFDYRLILHNTEEIDAVIVHELCHQVVFDHGEAFYEAMRRYGTEKLYAVDQRLNRGEEFKLKVFESDNS